MGACPMPKGAIFKLVGHGHEDQLRHELRGVARGEVGGGLNGGCEVCSFDPLEQYGSEVRSDLSPIPVAPGR